MICVKDDEDECDDDEDECDEECYMMIMRMSVMKIIFLSQFVLFLCPTAV